MSVSASRTSAGRSVIPSSSASAGASLFDTTRSVGTVFTAVPFLRVFLGGFTRGLLLGRTQVGDRHLNFHEDRDTLAKGVDDLFVTTDINTLLTALYVKIDDWLGRPRRAGRPPRLSDAELLTIAVAQALLGIRSEARWLRFLPAHLPGAFPYLPGQSGYNKRLRAALPLLKRAIRAVAADTDVWTDNVWVTDSTPVECGRSRPTAKRSDLAGWAGYGYCASHSRFFWGLRLHLVCTPAGEVRSRSEEHTSELQSPVHLVCRLLLEKKEPTAAGRS